MTEMEQNLSANALLAGTREAFVQHLLSISRVVPDWVVEEDGPFTLLYHRHAPTPFDGVVGARLDPALAGGEIDRIMARFRKEGRSILWMGVTPVDAGPLMELLTARGFHAEKPLPAMAAGLGSLPLAEPLPGGLSVEPVRDDAAHASLAEIQVQTLGQEFGPRAWLKRALGLEGDSPAQHFLGRLDGRPVTAATAVYAGGMVTLYGIGTLPEVRGRGLGRAMTLQACRDARERGYEVAALFATPSGFPVYQKLGFETCGQFMTLFCPKP